MTARALPALLHASPVPASGTHRRAGHAAAVTTAVIAAAALLLLIPEAITSSTFASANYNEGWNIYHAMQVAHGAPLYDANLLRIVNYPYVSFYLTGWLGALTDAPLAVARILSWVGFAVTAASCAACARATGGSRVAQCLAAALFTGFAALVVPDFIGVADPQFLAEALSITALAVHLHARCPRTRVLVVPVITIISLFTKHQELAVPAAIFADMATNHRRELPLWLAAMLGLGLAFIGIGFLAGPSFLARLLDGRGYNAAFIFAKDRNTVVSVLLPLTTTLAWQIGRCPARLRPLFLTFGGVALATFLGFSGGDGVTRNVAVDFLVWLSIATALGTAAIPRSGIAAALLVLVTGFPIAFQSACATTHLRRDQAEALARARDFRADIAFIAAHHGPAICETMLLCYEAGQPLIVDPFNAAEQVALGNLPASALTRLVTSRRIAMVQFIQALHDDRGVIRVDWYEGKDGIPRFTEPFLRAVWVNYQLDHVDRTGAFYVPRR